jgi:hypothetical protein
VHVLVQDEESVKLTAKDLSNHVLWQLKQIFVASLTLCDMRHGEPLF